MSKAAFVLLKLASTGAVGYLEDAAGATYPEETQVIQQYATAYQRLRNAALSAEGERLRHDPAPRLAHVQILRQLR